MARTKIARSPRPWFIVASAGLALGLLAPTALATPECPADIDGDGSLTLFDFLEFQNLFALGDPGADFDGDGDLTLFDFLEFQNQFALGCPTGEGAIEAELAAVTLPSYPFASFVDAFNSGSVVRLAVDPGRFPSVSGQTADVYVVANKTRAQWEADASLVDVRGAPQEVAFSGATIQTNTFALTGSGTLAGPGDADIARGYDLVVDLDRDGTLSDGDLIDGQGDLGGFSIFKDLTTLGPYATAPALDYAVTWPGIISTRNRQIVVFPANLDELPPLPLVVISHGNGHQYIWYDFLQQHLASHGFIVMANQNDTQPGIETASTSTYLHTDAFLGSLDTIGGGVLVGEVDPSRIIWIGHSRGGEGVARAYTRVRDGLVATQNYDAQDIVLVSSIAPNNSLGTTATAPGLVNYHLLWGSSDGDISGAPSAGVSSFAIHDRAIGNRYSTYIHGADHNDFNCCGFDDFTGPAGTAIGRAEAQQVQKALYLALAKLHAEKSPGGLAGLEYLWRQAESLESLSVSQTTVVVREYRETTEGDDFYIDDFQTNPSVTQSSSGGAVAIAVDNAQEILQSDTDGAYTWTGTQPSNGMTRATSADTSRGMVFDWTSDASIEFEIIESQRDWTDDQFLSFRAAQGTRHPQTIAALADLVFDVTLRDGAGNTSTINIGAYAGGVEEPYQRTGSGTGAGWQNEYETVRIRLADFLTNASGLDLGDIVALRFDFGPSHGAAQGRLGLDDLYVSNNREPLGINFGLEGTLPDIVPPGQPVTVRVNISARDGEAIVPGSPVLRYRFDGGAFLETTLDSLGGGLYEGEIPAAACGEAPEFFFAAQGTVSGEVVFPPTAPTDTLSYAVANQNFIVDLNFETAVGWTVENFEIADGGWDRGVPAAWGRGDPSADFDGSGQCFLTDNDTTQSNSDVDGGPTTLLSPVYDLSATPGAIVSYARWFTNDDLDVDTLRVQVSNNGGLDWTTIEEMGHFDGWVKATWTIADFLPVTSQMRFRFQATDNPNDSVTEAGIDAFQIFTISCP